LELFFEISIGDNMGPTKGFGNFKLVKGSYAEPIHTQKIEKSGSLPCPFNLWGYPYLWAHEEEGEEQEGAESRLVWPEHPSFGT
jgi:hypothetical protein